MNKQPILDLLQNYQTTFNEEIEFQKQIIDFLTQNDDFALRSNPIGQLTGSAWIVNKERTKVLLIHHKKLNKWLQIGGHIEDTDQTIEQTVLREIEEESGIKNLKLLSSVSNLVYDIDIHTIPQKNGIAEHLHFDIRLLVEADENEKLIPQNEEILAIKWYALHEIEDLTKNYSIKRMIDKMDTFTILDTN